MSRFKMVPGAPFVHWQSNGENFEGHQLFSYSRHAMIQFLRFLKQKRNLSEIRFLSPNYMCHEVLVSLEPEVESLSYYPVREDLSFRMEDLKQACLDQRANVVMVSHLYGKRVKEMAALRAWCDELKVFLLEDSAHLPPFFLKTTPQYSHVQFFTYRKLFGLPYGASSRVEEALRVDFESFLRDVPQISEEHGLLHFSKWLAREQVKKFVTLSGMPVRRQYQELGIDPLKEFNQLVYPVKQQLRHIRTEDFVESRRRNWRQLSAFFKEELPQWKVIEFDLDSDVPYQFLFYRSEKSVKINSVEIINRFLEKGISLVKGLELLPEVRGFENQLALPIHQDIRPEQVDYMIEICKKSLKF